MKLNELRLLENAPLSNAEFSVRYVTRAELDVLTAKYKFVASSPQEAFGYNSAARSLTAGQFLATMLTDIPARVTPEQMLKIVRLMDTGWSEAIVDTMVYNDIPGIYKLFDMSNPDAADPSKHPILVTTFKAWTEEVIEYLESNSDGEDEDDFEDDDQ